VSARASARAVLLRDVEIDGRMRRDCLVDAGRVVALEPSLQFEGAVVVEARGAALLPGLADHHLHLFAVAAAQDSVDLADAVDVAGMLAAASTAPGVRAIGWDDIRHGDLDRDRLDEIQPHVPVRVQHRSGSLWVLNTAALDQACAQSPPPPSAERDTHGRLTGRVWRGDEWVRLSGSEPDLANVGRTLARFGVTEVTDATPDLDARGVAWLIEATRSGAIPQRVQLLCATAPTRLGERLRVGPQKVVIGDHELPSYGVLRAQVAAARCSGRPVAVHCISYAALALAIAVLDDLGPVRGDRIEHAAEVDSSALAELRRLGVVVVTQPSMLARRGDDYLDRTPTADRPNLWRYRSLLDAGIPTVPSSDAPYGDLDPWATLAAAVGRTTRQGRVVSVDERVPVSAALAGLLTPVAEPGGRSRRVAVGAPADLLLLRTPLGQALHKPNADLVALTMIDGEIIYRAALL